MNYFFIGWALCVGMLVPFQAIINSQLSQKVGSPITASLISFSGGLLIFVVALFAFSAPLPRLSTLSKIPPYLMIGGLLGSIFVMSAILIVPRLGSTAWIALIVGGQLIMSLILDHYGILGLSVREVSPSRILGVMLLFLGAGLIIRY